MNFKDFARHLQAPALICAWLLGTQLAAVAQETPKSAVVSDAQIEANVLKALAGSPQLADERISTTTVYGEVTLSGSVKDETSRQLAETLASRAIGVKKVVDELTLTSDQPAGAVATPPPADSAGGYPPPVGSNPNLQSDGTMAPDNGQSAQQAGSGPGQYGAPANAAQMPPPQYRQPYAQRPYGPPPAPYGSAPEPYGAQRAGVPVTVPAGSMVRIRINLGLDSKHAQPGASFDGVVLNDVVADGAVAIPRGATVQGNVVDVKTSGALSGRGELSLQLTQVVLGGKVFPVVSDKWSSVGADKTINTVNNTVGLGAMGALIGAVAGGGSGAAIGAAAGGAAGLGVSAGSRGGQALVPPEAILTFHLTQSAQVATVSQAEMDRLAYGVPVGSQPRLVQRPRPGYYYGPGYYPRPIYYPYPY